MWLVKWPLGKSTGSKPREPTLRRMTPHPMCTGLHPAPPDPQPRCTHAAVGSSRAAPPAPSATGIAARIRTARPCAWCPWRPFGTTGASRGPRTASRGPTSPATSSSSCRTDGGGAQLAVLMDLDLLEAHTFDSYSVHLMHTHYSTYTLQQLEVKKEGESVFGKRYRSKY